MDPKILEKLSSLPDDSVVLTLLPREHHEELHMELIEYMVNKKKAKGVYVTLNRPYHNLVKALQNRKMNYKNLLFLDCITKKKSEADNCIFLRNPRSLTNIGMTLVPVYKNKDLSFIFFDSIDALSLYHDPKIVLRFARSLVERMRESGKRGIILGLQEEIDQRMVAELSVVCDTVIDLSE